LVAGAYKASELEEEAQEALKQVSEAILKFKTVYDEYDEGGNPYHQFLKKSFENSSFDAGVFIDTSSLFL
jgi:hypothetical protein